VQASARLPGVSFPHLKSCWSSNPGEPLALTVHFGRLSGGKGQHRGGGCDLGSTGPLMLGYELQRVRMSIGLRGGQRMGWQLVLYLGLQEYREGQRTSKGTFLEGRKEEGRKEGRAPHSRLVPKSCRKKVKM